MALVFADRVKETTTSTGTGTINLAGAATGYRTFVSGIGTTNTCYYVIAGTSEWEVGLGTVTSGSPDTLARSVIASSNANALVSFSAGTKDVFCTLAASKIGDFTSASDGYTLGGGTTKRVLTVTGADQTLTGSGTNVYTLPNRTANLGWQMNNFSTADQTINAATTALLTGSTISVPTDKLAIGTIFRWTISVTKTAAGTAANNFLVKLGTAGTTADTTILTLALPTATGVVDTAKIVIEVTSRGPLSASGIFQGHLNMTHNLQTTGFATISCVNVVATSSAFNVTTANLIMSVACTTAASTVLTFKQIITEAINL